MNKARVLAIAATLLAPLGAYAEIETVWPESIFLDYPIGAPGFPVIPNLEPNHISIAGVTGTTVVVSSAYDLVTPDYNSGPVNTYLFNTDGMATRFGSGANKSIVTGDGATVIFRESGVAKFAPAANPASETTIGLSISRFSVDNTGARIAYLDSGDVWVADLNTLVAVMVHMTDANSIVDIVQISGDGSKVVFVEQPDGDALTPKPPELFVVDYNGANLVKLLDGGADGAQISNGDIIRGADITDDGSVVVYAKSWARGVFKINSDGSDGVQLVNTENAQWPRISGDGSAVAFITDAQDPALGGSSESDLLTPFSFDIASPSQIKAHVPFGLGIDRQGDVDWVDISQDGEWVFYTSPDRFSDGDYTRDFRDVYVYRSNGSSATGSSGAIPGGIGTQEDASVTALDRYSIALLLLALVTVMLRSTRRRQVIRKRIDE